MKLNSFTLSGRRMFLALILFGLLNVIFSCENQQIDSSKSSTKNEIPIEIIQKLNTIGFNTDEGLSKYKNGYLVEYDILLTAADIDALIAVPSITLPNGRSQHYTSNLLVKATPRNLLVYMDPTFNTFMQNAFDAALTRYNNVGLGLTFQRTNSTSLADIIISAFYEQSNRLGYSSSPGFPSASNPNKYIYLNTYYYNNQRVEATSTIAHEIGHAIGFRHTDFMDRSYSCGGSSDSEGSASVGANYVPGTPTGPSTESWMLACNPGYDRPFTSEDINALKTVYPQKVAPVGFLSVYRYLGAAGDHFYTANWNELGSGKNGYVLEGTEFYIGSSATYAPAIVYRYVQTSNNFHFYTANFAELGNGKNGMVRESDLGYAFGSQVTGTVPIYRYVSNTNGDHFYTQVSQNYPGYSSEGIAFYTQGYPY